jgi:hypothetical protein
MVKGMDCAPLREKSGASRTLRRVTIGAGFSRGWRLSKLFVGLCGDDWDRRTCTDINKEGTVQAAGGSRPAIWKAW